MEPGLSSSSSSSCVAGDIQTTCGSFTSSGLAPGERGEGERERREEKNGPSHANTMGGIDVGVGRMGISQPGLLDGDIL